MEHQRAIPSRLPTSFASSSLFDFFEHTPQLSPAISRSSSFFHSNTAYTFEDEEAISPRTPTLSHHASFAQARHSTFGGSPSVSRQPSFVHSPSLSRQPSFAVAPPSASAISRQSSFAHPLGSNASPLSRQPSFAGPSKAFTTPTIGPPSRQQSFGEPSRPALSRVPSLVLTSRQPCHLERAKLSSRASVSNEPSFHTKLSLDSSVPGSLSRASPASPSSPSSPTVRGTDVGKQSLDSVVGKNQHALSSGPHSGVAGAISGLSGTPPTFVSLLDQNIELSRSPLERSPKMAQSKHDGDSMSPSTLSSPYAYPDAFTIAEEEPPSTNSNNSNSNNQDQRHQQHQRQQHAHQDYNEQSVPSNVAEAIEMNFPPHGAVPPSPPPARSFRSPSFADVAVAITTSPPTHSEQQPNEQPVLGQLSRSSSRRSLMQETAITCLSDVIASSAVLPLSRRPSQLGGDMLTGSTAYTDDAARKHSIVETHSDYDKALLQATCEAFEKLLANPRSPLRSPVSQDPSPMLTAQIVDCDDVPALSLPSSVSGTPMRSRRGSHREQSSGRLLHIEHDKRESLSPRHAMASGPGTGKRRSPRSRSPGCTITAGATEPSVVHWSLGSAEVDKSASSHGSGSPTEGRERSYTGDSLPSRHSRLSIEPSLDADSEEGGAASSPPGSSECPLSPRPLAPPQSPNAGCSPVPPAIHRSAGVPSPLTLSRTAVPPDGGVPSCEASPSRREEAYCDGSPDKHSERQSDDDGSPRTACGSGANLFKSAAQKIAGRKRVALRLSALSAHRQAVSKLKNTAMPDDTPAHTPTSSGDHVLTRQRSGASGKLAPMAALQLCKAAAKAKSKFAGRNLHAFETEQSVDRATAACLRELAIPCEQRVVSQTPTLQTYLGRCKPLQSLSRSQLSDLSLLAKLYTCETDDVVFIQGDVGTVFYICLSGAVNICVGDVEPSAKMKLDRRLHSGESTCVDTVVAGETFGELALINAAPRSASAIAVGPTQLIGIDKSDYDRIVKPSHARLLEETIQFLAGVSLFRSWHHDALVALCACMQEKKFLRNEFIVRQGEKQQHIVFIREGCCCVLKTGLFNRVADSGTAIRTADVPSEFCTPRAQTAKGSKVKVLELAVLGPFEFIGDSESLTKTTWMSSVVAESDVTVLLAPLFILSRLDKATISVLRETAQQRHGWRQQRIDTVSSNLKRSGWLPANPSQLEEKPVPDPYKPKQPTPPPPSKGVKSSVMRMSDARKRMEAKWEASKAREQKRREAEEVAEEARAEEAVKAGESATTCESESLGPPSQSQLPQLPPETLTPRRIKTAPRQMVYGWTGVNGDRSKIDTVNPAEPHPITSMFAVKMRVRRPLPGLSTILKHVS